MSATLDTPEPPPIPRATPSPRTKPLDRPDYPPGDDPNEQQEFGDAPEEDDIPYPEPNAEQPLLPPPNFRPFFALIEDTTSGEHYHPYVHYVFADDDPTIVTAASMRGLGLDDTRYLPHDAPAAGDRRRGQEGDEEEVEGEEYEQDPPVESPFPPPIPGVKEHYLIVDVGEDGRTIVDAQSLSPEWQIIDTGVRTAPSFDEDSPDPGYMLRIEGVEIPRKNKGKAEAGIDKLTEAREQQGDIFGALEGLIQGIERGLGIAHKISSAGRREGEEGIPTDVCEQDTEKTVGDEQ